MQRSILAALMAAISMIAETAVASDRSDIVAMVQAFGAATKDA
jgi:hypothetical protein